MCIASSWSNHQLCRKRKYSDVSVSAVLWERVVSSFFESKSVIIEILPETLAGFGMLMYGKLADLKGRKTAMKITWRMYTFGIIIYAVTQTMFLRIFGYLIACFHCFPALILTFILFFEQNTEKNRNTGILLLWASLFIGPLVYSLISKFLFT